MGCFYKSHSKEQYLWICIGLSHYHPVIPEERPGDSSGCRHCRKPRKLLLLFSLLKQYLTSDHARGSAAPGWHMQESTCTQEENQEWTIRSTGEILLLSSRCRDQRGGHFLPCKLLMAKCSLEMLVSMFGHALLWAPGTWQWECSKPWVRVLDAVLPLPAMFLSCTAESLLELALLLQREGVDLIPSSDKRQPVLS